MHTRQLAAKAANCGYARPFGASKKKKQSAYKLKKSLINKNSLYNYDK